MELNIPNLLQEIKNTPAMSDHEYMVGDWHSGNGTTIFPTEFKPKFIAGEKGDKPLAREAKEMRNIAKTVGLSLLYGGTEYTVSNKLGISKDEAAKHVSSFISGVPVFATWSKNQIKTAKEKGYVTDVIGRVRYLPHINNRDNWKMMAAYERGSLNFPVQGSGASQLKLSVVALGKYIEENRLNRFHGNLLVNYRPYTRIVSVGVVTPELEEVLGSLEDGNVKVVVSSDGTNVSASFDRPVRLKQSHVKQFGMKVVW